jgi:uncharacterized protein YdaU (DUF1376 family)
LTDKKPDAWMPLYIGDWDSGTRHLDCEQDGAYGRLVRHYWKNGALPDDDAQLSRIVGMPLGRWRKIRTVIAGFFTVAGGRWTHKRVEAELVNWTERKAKAKARAEAAAEARWNKDNPSGPKPKRPKRDATSTPQAMLDQCPSPSPRKEEGQLHSPSSLPSDASADLPDGGQSAPVRLVWDETAESDRLEREAEERLARKSDMATLLADLGGKKRVRR